MASKLASGNISPSVFVYLDNSAGNDGHVLQATASTVIYGVSQEGSRRAPLTGWDDGYCAILGENLRVYANPEDKDCFLTVSATVKPGDKLASDANGNGTPTTTANTAIGAVAEENGTTGQLIRVRLLPPGTNL